jgi:hypothetical protein
MTSSEFSATIRMDESIAAVTDAFAPDMTPATVDACRAALDAWRRRMHSRVDTLDAAGLTAAAAGVNAMLARRDQSTLAVSVYLAASAELWQHRSLLVAAALRLETPADLRACRQALKAVHEHRVCQESAAQNLVTADATIQPGELDELLARASAHAESPST